MNTKKFVVATVAAFAFAFAATVASAVSATEIYTPSTGFLSVGSGMGARVSQMSNVIAAQGALNACVPGMDLVLDGKFGPLTKGKFVSFQASKMIAQDGVIGPITAGFLAGCSGNVVTPGNNGGGTLSGGETSIDSINLDDADDTNIEEGSEETEVAQLEFDVEDADAELVRADFTFDGTGNDEERPWNTFDKVYLMDGSDVLASMSSDSKDDWDETDTSDVYRIRLSGINAVFDEGDSANLSVAVDLASSIDGVDDGEDWVVSIETDGLRFVDGAGVDTQVDTSDEANFTIEASGAQSDLTVSKDSSSPDAGVLEVDETSSTTETIAVFKVKADSDGGDVKMDDFPVTLTVASTGNGDDVSDVVDDVYLVIDGTTYTTDTSASTTAATTTFAFSDIEDDDVVIEAGDTLKITVKVKFNSQDGGPFDNASTIYATSAVDDSDFEDADTGDNIATQTLATPSSEVQTLYATGIQYSNFEVVGDNPQNSTNDDGDNTKLTWKVSYDITAFGDTFYIPKTVVQGTTSSSAGLMYTVYDETTAAVTTAGTESASSLSSGADDSDYTGYYTINEGDTETFTATISVQLGSITAGDFIKVQLDQIGYNADGAGADTQLDFSPASDYDTLSDSIDA